MQKRKSEYNSPYSQKKKTFKKYSLNSSSSSESKISVETKIKLLDCPKVENLKDLIKLGETYKFYKNIDVKILWDVLPYLTELDMMIGMQSVKETIFYQVIYYLQGMHNKNRNEEYLHTIITGSPGCGKTSLAKIIGLIYKNLGILSRKSTFTIATREDFIGEHLGSTAIKTSKLLNFCLGGVLFIDEVYSMGPGQKDKDSFSKEAIDTLCAFLSEHKNDFCCIVAGYEDEIKKCFLSVNPGLERRFPWIHNIDEYTEQNLSDIFIKMIKDIQWTLDEVVEKNFIVSFFKDNKEYFKNNGGDIETFLSKIKMAHSIRVFCLDKKFKFIINKEDITNALKMLKKIKKKEKNNVPNFMYI